MPTAQVDCWALLAPELLQVRCLPGRSPDANHQGVSQSRDELPPRHHFSQEIFKQFSVEECGSLRLVCRSWSTAAVGSPETWAESVQLPVCAVACDADTALFDRLAQRLPFVSRLRLHHTWRAQCDAAAADALQRLARWRQLDALEIRDSSSCRRSAQPSGFPTHWSLPPHAAEAVDLSHLRSLELLVQELGCGRGRSPWERLLESPSLASGLRRLSLRWVAVDTDIIHQHDPPASSAAGPMRTADALWHIHGRMTQLEHLSLAGCDLDELVSALSTAALLTAQGRCCKSLGC